MPIPASALDPDELRRRLDSEDPRAALELRLSVRERVIATIEARLERNPEDPHQRFILAEHQKARAEMIDALRQLNLAQDLRYRDLAAYVEDYVSGLDARLPEADVDADQAAELENLGHEQQAWEAMIEKVRTRLQKRPGDPQLMRLLGEHQARLLKVQELRRVLMGSPRTASDSPPAAYAGDELVLDRLAASESLRASNQAEAASPAELPAEPEQDLPVPAPAERVPVADEPAAPDPRRIALLRELEVFAGMVEKTRLRLAAKPELLQLQTLIQQHELRLAELRQALAELDAAGPDSEPGPAGSP